MRRLMEVAVALPSGPRRVRRHCTVIPAATVRAMDRRVYAVIGGKPDTCVSP